MEPTTVGALAVIAVGGVLVGALVLWWTVRAAVSMVKRALALLFVLGVTGALLVAAALALAVAR